MKVVFDILAIIACTFEEDLCQWKNADSNANIQWSRYKADELNGKPGPSTDWSGQASGHYILSSHSSSDDNEMPRILSPYFYSVEHPFECFTFYFYFAHQGEVLGLYLEDKQGKPTLYWELSDSWNTEARWVQGQVRIEAEEVTQEYEYRVGFWAMWSPKDENVTTFIALDEFEFLEDQKDQKCPTLPPEAAPIKPTDSTPAPTEGPGRK